MDHAAGNAVNAMQLRRLQQRLQAVKFKLHQQHGKAAHQPAMIAPDDGGALRVNADGIFIPGGKLGQRRFANAENRRITGLHRELRRVQREALPQPADGVVHHFSGAYGSDGCRQKITGTHAIASLNT